MRPSIFAIAVAGLIGTCSVSAAAQPYSGELTNAAQIRDLANEKTVNRLPVHLIGVLIDSEIAAPDRHSIILADSTACIYVLTEPNAQNVLTNYHVGDLLEINGVSGAGQFAPIVIVRNSRKLGTAPIPAAQPVTYQQLITGALDAQWIEIKGVVRRYFRPESGSNIGRIVIAVDGGLVQARFYPQNETAIQEDAEVCIHAVCLYQYNQKRQILKPVLQVPRGEPVKVIKAAPESPFSTPVRSAISLLTFSPENLHGYAHRVHVRGTVTSSQPGSFIWIRDGTSGLRIQTDQGDQLQPGDKIDVLGFPVFGVNTPELKDAIFRKIGSTETPAPIPLTNVNDAFDHEDDLVVVEGKLTQAQPVLNGIVFSLDNNGQLFRAISKIIPGEQIHPDWQSGAQVRITGICSLIHDDSRPFAGIWQPKSFEVLLRSPADLVVLKSPPWWTPKHALILLGTVTAVLMLIIGILVALSRYRLREQKRHREMAEAEFAAILSERNRLAREIHDTLAQGLAAISVQLQLAKKSANGAGEIIGHHLDSAQALVRGSLAEARNSIWDMRAHVLETNDLPGALKGIFLQTTQGTPLKTSFDVSGKSRRLAPMIENDVLRVGQEAITNAAKHSGAKNIGVKMEFHEQQLRLTVSDDGCGFDPRNPPSSEGGFGLMGMRERAAELKGELKIESSAEKGTKVVLTVRLSGD
ncbi:MAG TPA: histidine kinase [Verrucomicrobiae bacterium]|nr:histidine kinase [Verrucomicrobiae bacterium]